MRPRTPAEPSRTCRPYALGCDQQEAGKRRRLFQISTGTMASQKSHVPASAAGPYNKMHANTEENQLRDLPRTLSMMSATTLTPTAAPMNALDTATIPLTSSDTKLVPFFNAGAGSTNVNRPTMSARTAVREQERTVMYLTEGGE